MNLQVLITAHNLRLSRALFHHHVQVAKRWRSETYQTVPALHGYGVTSSKTYQFKKVLNHAGRLPGLESLYTMFPLSSGAV